MLRISHCLGNRLTDGGKVVNPIHRLRSTPQKKYFSASGTHFCKPEGLVRSEGLGKFKKNHLIESLSRDLPACSTVPWPVRYHVPPWCVMRLRNEWWVVCSNAVAGPDDTTLGGSDSHISLSWNSFERTDVLGDPLLYLMGIWTLVCRYGREQPDSRVERRGLWMYWFAARVRRQRETSLLFETLPFAAISCHPPLAFRLPAIQKHAGVNILFASQQYCPSAFLEKKMCMFS
jgi:hypothetical protein